MARFTTKSQQHRLVWEEQQTETALLYCDRVVYGYPVREVLLYRDSSDIKICSSGIEVRTGREWKAHKAVNQPACDIASLIGTVVSHKTSLQQGLSKERKGLR